MGDYLELIKIVLELAALVCVPIAVYLLSTTQNHKGRIQVLEEKVNAQIKERLDGMESKLEAFDTRIERKLDMLESNLNTKINMMTSLLNSFVQAQTSEKPQ